MPTAKHISEQNRNSFHSDVSIMLEPINKKSSIVSITESAESHNGKNFPAVPNKGYLLPHSFRPILACCGFHCVRGHVTTSTDYAHVHTDGDLSRQRRSSEISYTTIKEIASNSKSVIPENVESGPRWQCCKGLPKHDIRSRLSSLKNHFSSRSHLESIKSKRCLCVATFRPEKCKNQGPTSNNAIKNQFFKPISEMRLRKAYYRDRDFKDSCESSTVQAHSPISYLNRHSCDSNAHYHNSVCTSARRSSNIIYPQSPNIMLTSSSPYEKESILIITPELQHRETSSNKQNPCSEIANDCEKKLISMEESLSRNPYVGNATISFNKVNLDRYPEAIDNDQDPTNTRSLNCYKHEQLNGEYICKKYLILQAKIDSLRWRIEYANYLNWLNAPLGCANSGVAITGLWAPAPNPNMAEIRLGDVEIRRTLALHDRYCAPENILDEKLQLQLRTSEFNNWDHDDAELMRFLRQMYVDLELTAPHLPISTDELDRWIRAVYQRNNQVPFHNFKHAFMVAQMSYAIIWKAKLQVHMAKLDQLTLITAAINHDLDHPGFNNAYQINAGTQLAMRYNDRSPLENHHASTTFEILYGVELNPFRNLAQPMVTDLREGIIRCILATDMACHNDILGQFKDTILANKDRMWQLDESTGRPIWASEKQYLNVVMSILIKVSDISNESRPLDVATPWIDRLLEEFFYQSDYEKRLNLPSAPFMDREKVTKSESQYSFITYVIMPLFMSLCELFPDLEGLLIEPAKRQLEHYKELLPDY